MSGYVLVKRGIAFFIVLLLVNIGRAHAQINIDDVQFCGPGTAAFTTSDAGCTSYEWYNTAGIKVYTGCNYTTPMTAFDQQFTVKNPSVLVSDTVSYIVDDPLLGAATLFTGFSTTDKYTTLFEVKNQVQFESIKIKYKAPLVNPGTPVIKLTLWNGFILINTFYPVLQFDGLDHEVTVTMNESLSAGSYSLKIEDYNAGINFVKNNQVYANTSGANYTLGGPLSSTFINITGNGTGTSIYGGAYEWKIQTQQNKTVKATDVCAAVACVDAANTAPLVKIDFGTGNNPGSPLPAGVTTYTYNSTSISDGMYCISNNTSYAQPGGWLSGSDHTAGDVNGRMMVVNASHDPGEFYRVRVNNLCSNAFFVFSAWFANILSPTSVCGATGLPINIMFRIEDVNGNILSEKSTGDIAKSSALVWQEFNLQFYLGTGQTAVNLVLLNNGPGGCGNDLAIDDISFTPCTAGAQIYTNTLMPACLDKPVVFGSNLSTILAGAPLNWQRSTDGGTTWDDISGATNKNYTAPKAINNYIYRLRIQNVNSTNCPIVSNVIIVTTEDCTCKQTFTLKDNVSICGNNAVDLSVSYTGKSIPSGSTFQYTIFRNGTLFGNYASQDNSTGTFSVNQTGVYRLTAVSSVCPTDSITIDTIKANVKIGAPSVTPLLTGPSQSCPDDSVQIITPATGEKFSWTVSGNTSFVKPLTAGNAIKFKLLQNSIRIIVRSENADKCISRDTFDVSPFVRPQPPVANDVTYCKNDAASSLTAIGSPLRWYVSTSDLVGSATAPIPSTSVAGTVKYYVVQEDLNGCKSYKDSLRVIVRDLPNLSITVPDQLCSNSNSVQLKSTPTGAVFSGTGVTGTTLNPALLPTLQNTTISALYTDQYGCKDTKSAQVYVKPPLDVQLAIDKPIICKGEQAILSITNYSSSDKYKWLKNGVVIDSNVSNKVLTESGNYKVKIISQGCNVDSDTKSLSVESINIETETYYKIKDGDGQQLDAKITAEPSGTSFVSSWKSGFTVLSNTNSVYVVPKSQFTYYTITAETPFGCKEEKEVEIELEYEIIIPQIFSPNGDGKNETWVIYNIDKYPEATVFVYNRWGNQVMEKTTYLNDWNGTFNGEDLPVATYYYVVDMSKYGKRNQTGTLTVVR